MRAINLLYYCHNYYNNKDKQFYVAFISVMSLYALREERGVEYIQVDEILVSGDKQLI